MAKKYSRTFTLTKRAWEFLNTLKYQEQKNISAYVNALIIRDIENREENANNVK